MKLLLALDLREDHDLLLTQATQWAARLDATLDLVYVGMYGDLFQFIEDANVRALMEKEADVLRQQTIHTLEQILENVPDEMRGTFHTPAGPPATAIVSMEEDYDALLIGTHGRQGLARLWLGSVAERVVRTSTKPVLVLHAYDTQDAD